MLKNFPDAMIRLSYLLGEKKKLQSDLDKKDKEIGKLRERLQKQLCNHKNVVMAEVREDDEDNFHCRKTKEFLCLDCGLEESVRQSEFSIIFSDKKIRIVSEDKLADLIEKTKKSVGLY